jgi:hypothetical protein
MSDMNPYQSPQAHISAVSPAVAPGAVTETMRAYLKSMSGWMRFMGITGFISCGFSVIGGVFMVFLPAIFLQLHDFETADFSDFSNIFGALGGFAYIVVAVILFFPAFFLYKAGSRIRDYIRTGADSDLEDALRNNKAFWKFMGLSTIITIAAIPVLIVAGVVIAVSAAAFM